MLKGVIIEDEPLARLDLRMLLEAHADVLVLGEAATLPRGRELIAQHRDGLDVVFLDIHLRGGDGFELLPEVPPRARVVFVTADESYAIRAFEINALDYLSKPVSAERLAVTLERLRHRDPAAAQPESEAASARYGEDDRVLLRTERTWRFVALSDVAAITSLGGNYACVHLISGEELVVRKTFKEWERELPAPSFLRVHRSVIVHTRFVETLAPEEAGGHEVRVRGLERPLPVSRRLVGALRDALVGSSTAP